MRQLKPTLTGEITEKAMRRSLAYWLMAGPGRHALSGPLRRAKMVWLEQTAGQLKAALRRKGLVVWGNAFFPFELLYGLGVTPHRPETMAALAAKIGLGQRAIGRAESGFYSPDTCSFYRCALGLDMGGLLPKPDIVVAVNLSLRWGHQGLPQLQPESMAAITTCWTFPITRRPGPSPTWRASWKSWRSSSPKKQGKPLDRERMAEAMRLANEAREYMLKINELRKAIAVPALRRGCHQLYPGHAVLQLRQPGRGQVLQDALRRATGNGR